MELLLKFNIIEILIVSVGTSFLVEAISHLSPKTNKRILLPVVALVSTILRIFPFETLNFSQPSGMVFNFLVTVSFSILFYKYGGERITKGLLKSLTGRILDTTKSRENEPFE